MPERLSKYRIMWVFVYFDLPTTSKKERKSYVQFRKLLLEDGFRMMQYSVYTRHCPSRENADVHIKRVEKWLPTEGEVIILQITDAQFSRIRFFSGTKEKDSPDSPQQLTLF